jgi:8-oxo-dGTP pyrophosphatase MutT (NUDIX family)
VPVEILIEFAYHPLRRRTRMATRRKGIRSAGAVLLNDGEQQPRVLVVQRRRQQDWTLPKGRRRPRERGKAAARREVREETGVRCAAGCRLLKVRWQDQRGRPRRIAYWLLEPAASEEFHPTEEVAAIAWLPASDAISILDSARDRRAVQRGVARIRSRVRAAEAHGVR